MTITSDDQLVQDLTALSEIGGSGELRAMTDFEWDVVHVFIEGATSGEIEETVGETVIRDTRYYDAGNLFVFVLDGEVVRAVSVVPDLMVVDQPTWSASVRVGPVDGRPGLLRLDEP